MAKPLISVCAPSNRTFLWLDFHEKLTQYTNDVNFEIIIVGPEEADFKLPSNINFIKTADIKVPQCNEVAIRNAQGNMLIFLGDDHIFWEAGLDDLYRETQRHRHEHATENLILLPMFKCGNIKSSLQFPYTKIHHPPYASIGGALLDRELLSNVKGGLVDTRFLGIYWDCDLAMRLNQAGVKIIKSTEIWLVEPIDPRKTTLHHRPCKRHDMRVLCDFWTREVKENEEVPSGDTYGHMNWPENHVLSKKRLTPFTGYEDKDLLTKSQGPRLIMRKGIVQREWV